MDYTINEIQLYRSCPMKYKFQYIDQYEPEFIDGEKWYKDCMKRLIIYTTIQRLDGKSMTLLELKQHLDMLLSDVDERKLTHKSIFAKGLNKIVSKAVTNIIKYTHSTIYKKNPLGAAFPFTIQVNNNNTITGTIDIIIFHNNETELIKIGGTTAGIIDNYLPFDDILTLYSYVFRKVFKEKEDYVSILSQDFRIFRTTRSPEQYKPLLDSLSVISNNILDRRFYPINNWTCKTCEYRIYCMAGRKYNVGELYEN